jgi:hypothetical protein
MEYTPRFELLNKILYWNYRIQWYSAPNPHDGGKYWEHEENWFLLFGIDARLFDYEEFHYDQHKLTTITILGIVLGKGYSYQNERIL